MSEAVIFGLWGAGCALFGMMVGAVTTYYLMKHHGVRGMGWYRKRRKQFAKEWAENRVLKDVSFSTGLLRGLDDDEEMWADIAEEERLEKVRAIRSKASLVFEKLGKNKLLKALTGLYRRG